jgi:hypothetical protein
MAAPTTLSDQLREFLAIQDASKQTTEDILKQRDLMNLVAKAASKAKIPFDKITGDIGQSVKDLKLFEGVERRLNKLTTDRYGIESNLEN